MFYLRVLPEYILHGIVNNQAPHPTHPQKSHISIRENGIIQNIYIIDFI